MPDNLGQQPSGVSTQLGSQTKGNGKDMVTVEVRSTRGSQLYTLDETARFEISVDGQDELDSDATVKVQLSTDTAVVLLEKEFCLAGATMPLVVEGTCRYPGSCAAGRR